MAGLVCQARGGSGRRLPNAHGSSRSWQVSRSRRSAPSDIDPNGHTTPTDYGMYRIERGALVFDETVQAAAKPDR